MDMKICPNCRIMVCPTGVEQVCPSCRTHCFRTGLPVQAFTNPRGTEGDSSSKPTPCRASNRSSRLGVCISSAIAAVLFILVFQPFPIIWRTTGVDTGDGWVLYLDESNNIQSFGYKLTKNPFPADRLKPVSSGIGPIYGGGDSWTKAKSLEDQFAREQEALEATLNQSELDEEREVGEIISVTPKAIVVEYMRWPIRGGTFTYQQTKASETDISSLLLTAFFKHRDDRIGKIREFYTSLRNRHKERIELFGVTENDLNQARSKLSREQEQRRITDSLRRLPSSPPKLLRKSERPADTLKPENNP